MMTSLESEHQWVVITGASSGIGYAAAISFATQGYSVALIAKDENQNSKNCPMRIKVSLSTTNKFKQSDRR